jgi:glyoxylase-like metal-dependent hydrolase (beta-lactamase superfamily II)
MGDDFVTYGFPFVDIAAGGSVRGIANALDEALARLPTDVKVIPGHGPLSTPADVRAYVKMLRDTTAVVEKALRAGKSLEQMKSEKVLAPWQKYSGDFVTTDLFIETLYNDLTGKKSDAPPIKHN